MLGKILYHILDNAAGGSYDWAKAVAGINFSYTPELRHAYDEGYTYFVNPPVDIHLSGSEVMAAIIAMATDIYYREN